MGKRYFSGTRGKADGDQVMTGSTEGISVRGVGEAAKNMFQAEGPRRVLGYLDGEIGLLDSLLAHPVERDAQPAHQGRRAVISDMNIHAVQAFIRGPDRAPGQRAFQEPIRTLRPAFRI
jgi:hypothetical protein